MIAEPPGTRERDEAIAAVTYGAGAWIDDALVAIAYVISRRDRFTTDAVWRVQDLAGVAAPTEPRAMGGAMTRARALGWIEATPDFVPSVRPECHRKPNRIWQRAR